MEVLRRIDHSIALRPPHKIGDACCDLRPQGPRQVMSHSFDQKKFCAWYGVRRCSPAAHIAHTVGETMDHEGGHLKTP
jgi:hypothetical protein